MASPLSTHFRLAGPLEAAVLIKAREQLAALGVSRLEHDMGVVMVTYDPSRLTSHVLVANLRSVGVPIS